MKFLVDHQLPPALARFFESEGHSAQHVRELGLKQADDLVIWRHAMTNDMVVVSKDEDFYFIATPPGAAGKLIHRKSSGSAGGLPKFDSSGSRL